MLELFKLAGVITVEGLQTVNKQMIDFEKSTKRAIAPMMKFSRQAQAAGKTLTKNLTLPLAALGGAAVKFAGDFEKAMVTSTAIMGDLSDEMKTSMAETAKIISKQTTFSADELAKSYYYLASAGYSAEQSIAALGKVASFAAAGQFDLQIATDLLTDAQSALGLSAEDAAENEANLVRVSDVLVKANTLANASVQQFSEALTNRAGAALRMVGKDVEEGVAVLAAYADQGTKGAEAGTQLAIVMRDLQKANQENAEEFRNAGVAVYDTAGEMRNMADIIGDVEDALEGKSDADKKATLSALGFQEKSIASLLTLVDMSEKIREYETNLRSAAGTTDEVAKNQLKNFNDQMKIMRNRLQVAAINLGEKLLPVIQESLIPVLESMLEKLEGAIKFFTDLPAPLQKFIVTILAFTAAAGPALVVLGKLVGLVQTLPAILAGARIAVLGFTMVLQVNPIFAVVTAVAALTVGIISLTKAYKGVNEQMDKNRQKMKDDIEAKNLQMKNNLLTELIYHYETLNRAATEPVSSEDYHEAKNAADNLERSLAALGVTLEGSYTTRLANARQELGQLNEEEIEAIEIIGNANDVIDDGNTSLEEKKKLEETIQAIEKANFEVRKRRAAQEEEQANRRKQNTEKIIAWEEAKKEKQEEIDLKYQEANAKTLEDRLALLQKEKESELEMAEYYGANIQAVNDHYAAEEKKLRDEAEAESKKKYLDRMNTVADYANQIGGMIQGLYDNEAIRIENNYKREAKAIENSEKNEEEKKQALADLDEKYDQKRAALQKKQLIAEKAQAIFSIGINTAMAIVKSLPNLILSGIIGAMGAAQAAIVAAKPIPEMAEGGVIRHTRGGSMVRAAEAGEDEGFVPMKKGTASIASAIINSMRRFPNGQQEAAAAGAGGGTTNAVNLNIGTLIADENGIRELERRLKVVRVAENNRLGIA